MAEVAQEVLLFLNRPPPKIRGASGADSCKLILPRLYKGFKQDD